MIPELLTLSKIKNSVTNLKKSTLTGLDSSAAHFVLSQFISQSAKDCLILCPDPNSASILANDIGFFLPMLVADSAPFQILPFPGWEISPYSKLTPSIGNRIQRLRCLHLLKQTEQQRRLVITTMSALVQPTIPSDFLLKRSLRLRPGKEVNFSELSQSLKALGYSQSELVEDPGTFSIRGGIFDIFSPVEKWPMRIEFWGDQIESMRYFSPQSQRSLEDQSTGHREFVITPLKEILSFPEDLQKARENLRNFADENNLPRASRERIANQLANNIVTDEMDFLIPFFNEKVGRLLQFVDPWTLCFWLDKDKCQDELNKFNAKLELGFAKALQEEILCSPPTKISQSFPELLAEIDNFNSVNFSILDTIHEKVGTKIAYKYSGHIGLGDQSTATKQKSSLINLDKISGYIQELLNQDFWVFFVANSQAQLDRFAFLLAQKQIRSTMIAPGVALHTPPEKGSVILLLGSVHSGFRIDAEKIAFLSEDEIFGSKKHSTSNSAKYKIQQSVVKAISQTSLDDLQVGELLVHVEHGIGRYRGLIKLKSGGILGDYVFIEYAGADKLYLPIYRLESIQKYIGAPGASPALDRLGSQHFVKVKEKAKEAIKDIALGLLRIYAQRAASQGYAFSPPGEQYKAFEAAFPYDETPDQLKAIDEIIEDMCLEKPMDRLICGDVGYGKTEVAMRAAFLSAIDGKQVAVLVPTTVLAEQHLQSFRSRFENTAVKIESLSRFKSKKEQKEVLEKLQSGAVDIIIGTHRLLGKDVRFKDLGLLIIDEEQRFGVEHKEQLKKIRVSTDVLTLTATPIPRTLHFSLLGIRDISIIQTPPADRLSIRTYVAEFDNAIIKSAIETEIQRGGQVFFIHNRVQSIPTIFRILHEILPNVKIGVAHGQMPEGELEKVMLGFYQKKHDVLLATAIIENGLDVSSANTIIVNRADTFGLSQLYQIRGRVGRSQTRAFAYLLLPKDSPITDDARERLQVLQRHVELGSGFAISSFDLELRGAGDILGDAQSGHVTQIGYDMYMELLAEEIAALKGEEPKQVQDVEISSAFPAFLPEDYVLDARTRLSLYKRFSSFESEEEVDEGRKELLDRFGKVPPAAEELLWLLKIKILLRRYGFKSIKVGEEKISLEAGKEPKLDITKLLSLIAKNPQEFSLSPDSKIIMRRKLQNLCEAHSAVRYLIQSLAIVT